VDNVVMGNVCQDPILRQPRRGDRPVVTFTVAVNPRRRVGEAFIELPAVFHRVVCFGLMAENVNNTLRKGMEVVAVGEWVDDSYSDEQGQRRVQVALQARNVGPALRWATADVHKVTRATVAEHGSEAARVTDITPLTGRAAAERVAPASSGGPVSTAKGGRSGMHRVREAKPEPVTAGGG
jgi:single-strand DNA-binding protein